MKKIDKNQLVLFENYNDEVAEDRTYVTYEKDYIFTSRESCFLHEDINTVEHKIAGSEPKEIKVRSSLMVEFCLNTNPLEKTTWRDVPFFEKEQVNLHRDPCYQYLINLSRNHGETQALVKDNLGKIGFGKAIITEFFSTSTYCTFIVQFLTPFCLITKDLLEKEPDKIKFLKCLSHSIGYC